MPPCGPASPCGPRTSIASTVSSTNPMGQHTCRSPAACPVPPVQPDLQHATRSVRDDRKTGDQPSSPSAPGRARSNLARPGVPPVPADPADLAALHALWPLQRKLCDDGLQRHLHIRAVLPTCCTSSTSSSPLSGPAGSSSQILLSTMPAIPTIRDSPVSVIRRSPTRSAGGSGRSHHVVEPSGSAAAHRRLLERAF